jgi:hypothetical protein
VLREIETQNRESAIAHVSPPLRGSPTRLSWEKDRRKPASGARKLAGSGPHDPGDFRETNSTMR